MQIINSDELASKVWKAVSLEKPREVHSLETRIVTFNFKGIPVPMVYSVENVLNCERFRIVEYIPNNFVVKMLMKL